MCLGRNPGRALPVLRQTLLPLSYRPNSLSALYQSQWANQCVFIVTVSMGRNSRNREHSSAVASQKSPPQHRWLLPEAASLELCRNGQVVLQAWEISAAWLVSLLSQKFTSISPESVKLIYFPSLSLPLLERMLQFARKCHLRQCLTLCLKWNIRQLALNGFVGNILEGNNIDSVLFAWSVMPPFL